MSHVKLIDMKKIILSITVSFLFGACATKSYKISSLSEDKKIALQSLSSEPLELKVDQNKAEEVWSRINLFVSNHSSLKVAESSNYLLRTHLPSEAPGGCWCGYQFTKEVQNSKTLIKGSALRTPRFGSCKSGLSEACERNTKIAMRYARTGILDTDFISILIDGDEVDQYDF